ncbi:MAG TPA: hypothetical protein PLL00_00215 [Bacteroidia bacterium]|nr:hypothetical protein [Bacteroidia bacterium]
MKRRILWVAIVAIGATTTVTSCKKEYTCTCDRTYTKSTSSGTVRDGVYTYKDSRVKAEKRCNDNETQGSDILGEYTIDCEIQ